MREQEANTKTAMKHLRNLQETPSTVNCKKLSVLAQILSFFVENTCIL